MNFLVEIYNQIQQAETEFHRQPGEVKLFAVTKGREISAIQALAQAGQAAFGENYLQEALGKFKHCRS